MSNLSPVNLNWNFIRVINLVLLLLIVVEWVIINVMLAHQHLRDALHNQESDEWESIFLEM